MIFLILLKKIYFDGILINSNKKTRHIELEKKLNNLAQKVKLISTKQLTKHQKLNIAFLMVQNSFLQMDYKTI